MQEPWNLTLAEYVQQRIIGSGVSEEVFRDSYSDEHLRREYFDVIQDPPRDADLDLRVYDALPEGLQGRWRKFSYTLNAKLDARTEADREARQAPYNQAEDYLRGRIDALESIKPRKSKENDLLQRLRGLQLALLAPFATSEERDSVVSKLRRFSDYVESAAA